MTDLIVENPFSDPLEREFWEICVRRDLEAFLAQDWSLTGVDFCEDEFFGIDAQNSFDPAGWIPKYASLAAYISDFNEQSREFASKQFVDDPRSALYGALTITRPLIEGDRALVTKLFDGELQETSGEITELKWQSIFHFRRVNDRWLITGFVGYLPYK